MGLGCADRRLQASKGTCALLRNVTVLVLTAVSLCSGRYLAVAKMPRTWVPSARRQVADRHGCPASPGAVAPSPGLRILLIRTKSWPFRMPSASAA
jgi:hypothetical protein